MNMNDEMTNWSGLTIDGRKLYYLVRGRTMSRYRHVPGSGGAIFIAPTVQTESSLRNPNESIATDASQNFKVVVEDMYFWSNVAGFGGGGIANGALPGMLQIVLSEFYANRAPLGGGIYSIGGLNMSGSTFKANSSIDGGAAYVISDSNFSNVSFVENDARACGGAVYVATADAVCQLSHCEFSNNEARNFGGAISNEGYVAVEDCRFFGNQASGGGALANGTSGTMKVSGATFEENSATLQLGAAIGSRGFLLVEDSSFMENSGCGIVAVTEGYGEIRNSVFCGNHTESEYGGILVNQANALLENVTFKENMVKYAPVIRNSGTIAMKNVAFENEFAKDGWLVVNDVDATAEICGMTLTSTGLKAAVGRIENSGNLVLSGCVAMESRELTLENAGDLVFCDFDASGGKYVVECLGKVARATMSGDVFWNAGLCSESEGQTLSLAGATVRFGGNADVDMSGWIGMGDIDSTLLFDNYAQVIFQEISGVGNVVFGNGDELLCKDDVMITLGQGTGCNDFSGTAVEIRCHETGHAQVVNVVGGNLFFGDAQTFVVNGTENVTMDEWVGRYRLVLEDGLLRLDVAERMSAIVTIGDDALDRMDDEISFREAVECYSSEGENVEFSSGASISCGWQDDIVSAGDLTVLGNGRTTTSLAGRLVRQGRKMELEALTWNGDIIGGDMSALATADISLKMQDVDFAGKVYGGTCVSGGAVSLGNVRLDLQDVCFSTKASRIYGGCDASNGATVTMGDIQLDIGAASDRPSQNPRIFAGGVIAGGAVVTVGDITMNLAGRNWNNVFAGATNTDGDFFCGTVNTTISGGSYGAFLSNGTQVVMGNVVQKDSVMTIYGGEFAGQVSAGGMSFGGNSLVDGNATLNIFGGTFRYKVFAGSGANSSKNGGKTRISGNVYLNVNVSENEVFVENTCLYSASMGGGIVEGDSNMTFTGKGENLHFVNAVISGSSQASFVNGDSYVRGERNLIFDDFHGDFGASINNGFSRVVVVDSVVVLTDDVNTNNFATWEIEVGSDGIAFAWNHEESYNNFTGDVINIVLDENAVGSEWAVFAGTDLTLRGWNAAASVNICGSEAAFNTEQQAWTTDDFKFFRQGNQLVVRRYGT